jgi:hypothetical protein
LQALESLKNTKSIFTPYLPSDLFFADVTGLEETAGIVVVRANTSAFEAWICKIVFGAGGTKARNPSKAITSKHTSYTLQQKGNPDNMVHKALWAVTKPMIGVDEAEKKKEKKTK